MTSGAVGAPVASQPGPLPGDQASDRSGHSRGVASTERPQRPDGRHLLRGVTRRLELLPLRLRLVSVVVVLLLVALALTGSATSVLLRRHLEARIDEDLKSAAVPTAQAALETLRNRPNGDLPSSYAVRFVLTDGTRPIVINPTGERLVPDLPTLALDDPRVLSNTPYSVGSVGGDLRWRVVSGPLTRGAGTYSVAVPLAGVDRTVDQVRLLASLIGLAVAAACAVIGWFGVRRAFRPLTQIEDTAAAIAAGDLARRVPERTAKDEVTSLSRSLNSMLAQIEQSFAVREASEERMRQFVSDASHELRTPLAAVRGYAELFRQGAVSSPEDVATAMRRIEDEAARMGGLVQDMLVLTRLDEQRPMDFGSVDLTVLAADAVHDARALDPTRRVSLVGLTGELGPVLVQGDEAKLRQVVTNLVGNAVSHTPPGTAIEIAVGGTPAGADGPGHAQLQVRDHGPGVDPERARKVFERFYRADPSRVRSGGGGNGLGLAIAAAIVSAHRGKVGVAATPGGGATFVVQLPTGNSQSLSSPV